MNENEYQQWQCNLLNEINRVLTPDGSLFYNHKDRHYRKRDHPPEEFILRGSLKLYQTIIWDHGSTANQNSSFFFVKILKKYFGLPNPHLIQQYCQNFIVIDYLNVLKLQFGVLNLIEKINIQHHSINCS